MRRQRRRAQESRSAIVVRCAQRRVDQQQVLVVGGGLAGLNLALRLAEMPWPVTGRRQAPSITLVDPKDRFVFSPLLVDYALSGEVKLDEVAPPFEALLGHARDDMARLPKLPSTEPGRLQHLRGLIGTVDGQRRRAQYSAAVTGELQDLHFDALVYAPGQPGTSRPPTIEGLAEAVASSRAQAFLSLADAETLRTRLAAGNLQSIAVVGAGYVGVELATALAEECDCHIALFGNTLLQGSELPNRRRSEDRLQALGVIRYKGRVRAINEAGLLWTPASEDVLSTKLQQHESDLVLVTGAVAASLTDPDIEPRINLRSSSPDDYLRRAPGIFCIGDAFAAAVGTPATGQAAMQQAEVAAWNVFAQLSGLPRKAWRRYSPSVLGEYVSLGRNTAAAVVDASQLTKLVPPALPPAAAALLDPLVSASASAGRESRKVDLGGRAAAVLRRLSYLYRMPTLGHRAWVAKSWAERAAAEDVALPA